MLCHRLLLPQQMTVTTLVNIIHFGKDLWRSFEQCFTLGNAFLKGAFNVVIGWVTLKMYPRQKKICQPTGNKDIQLIHCSGGLRSYTDEQALAFYFLKFSLSCYCFVVKSLRKPGKFWKPSEVFFPCHVPSNCTTACQSQTGATDPLK